MPCLAHSRGLITACCYYNFELSFSKSPPGIPAVIALSQKFSIVCTLGINKLPDFFHSCCYYHQLGPKDSPFAPYPFKSLEGCHSTHPVCWLRPAPLGDWVLLLIFLFLVEPPKGKNWYSNHLCPLLSEHHCYSFLISKVLRGPILGLYIVYLILSQFHLCRASEN